MQRHLSSKLANWPIGAKCSNRLLTPAQGGVKVKFVQFEGNRPVYRTVVPRTSPVFCAGLWPWPEADRSWAAPPGWAGPPLPRPGCYTCQTPRQEKTRKGAPVAEAVHRPPLYEENVRSCKGNLGQGNRPRRRKLIAQPPSLRAELFFQRSVRQGPQLRRPHPVGRLQAEVTEGVGVKLQDRARRFASNRLAF